LNETIAQVMTNAQDKFFVPENLGGERAQLWIQLSREPIIPAAQSPNP
jgi:hypothetical protein